MVECCCRKDLLGGVSLAPEKAGGMLLSRADRIIVKVVVGAIIAYGMAMAVFDMEAVRRVQGGGGARGNMVWVAVGLQTALVYYLIFGVPVVFGIIRTARQGRIVPRQRKIAILLSVFLVALLVCYALACARF